MKLRALLLRTINNEKKLPFGDFYIKQSHLQKLLDECQKDTHDLTKTALNPIDKQNFDSVMRICDEKVTELLRFKVPGSDGTIKFLEILKYVIDSYMDKHLSPLERVYKIWYAVFILRMWRSFVASMPGVTLKENFVSSNCYVCIELNAHCLVKYILQLEKVNMPHLFMPHLLGSQPCEDLFRAMRSFTTTYSTVANCTVKEMLERVSKIELQNDISSSIGDLYVFPRYNQKSDVIEIPILPSVHEIEEEIERAKRNAINDAIALRLINAKEVKTFDFVCKLIPSYKMKMKPKTKHISPDAKRVQRPCNVHLDKVQLKNFVDQFRGKKVDENSPFVEIYRCSSKGRRTIVKKTSFVWLLRKEPIRLSSDRLERVKANANAKATSKKKNNKKCCCSTIQRYLKRKPKKLRKNIVYLKNRKCNKRLITEQ